MCPFFVALRPIGYCGCYGEGSFHPNIKRKKKYCVGKFSDCLFYQWETKPVIIKSARKLQNYGYEYLCLVNVKSFDGSKKGSNDGYRKRT